MDITRLSIFAWFFIGNIHTYLSYLSYTAHIIIDSFCLFGLASRHSFYIFIFFSLLSARGRINILVDLYENISDSVIFIIAYSSNSGELGSFGSVLCCGMAFFIVRFHDS